MFPAVFILHLNISGSFDLSLFLLSALSDAKDCEPKRRLSPKKPPTKNKQINKTKRYPSQLMFQFQHKIIRYMKNKCNMTSPISLVNIEAKILLKFLLTLIVQKRFIMISVG
jgi:hypothetical protein